MRGADIVKQVISLIVLGKTLLGIFVISRLIATQTVIRDVSTRTFGNDPEGPLMGSYLVHFVLHPFVGYGLAVIGVCLMIKEVWFQSINRKLVVNFAGLSVALSFAFIYMWVVENGYLIPAN